MTCLIEETGPYNCTVMRLLSAIRWLFGAPLRLLFVRLTDLPVLGSYRVSLDSIEKERSFFTSAFLLSFRRC
jgi:hypothetical protein